jgi:hypothetical protein
MRIAQTALVTLLAPSFLCAAAFAQPGPSVRPCEQGGGVCLATPDTEIRLSATGVACDARVFPASARLLGGDQAAASYCEAPASAPRPALAVVDLTAEAVVAQVAVPKGEVRAFVGSVADPQGRAHPFLAPALTEIRKEGFNYVCIHSPAQAPFLPKRCPKGFVEADARQGKESYRELGGTVQDVDGDGWEDLRLSYHGGILTLSGRTGKKLAFTEMNPSAFTEPQSNPIFHSGRMYGLHTAFTAPGGDPRLLILAASPVGALQDIFCNVSRFVGVIGGKAGSPSSHRPRWSLYTGFHSTDFSAFDPSLASHPPVRRAGDQMDGCLHRFSDGRALLDGARVVAFNVFRQRQPVDDCVLTQYQLYLPPAWTPAKNAAWNACATRNLKAQGSWAARVLREENGADAAILEHAYVWGRASGIAPGGETLYLAEELPGDGSFDLSDRAQPRLRAYALTQGQFLPRASFPGASRPRIQDIGLDGAHGTGDFIGGGLRELVLRDVDADGFRDVQLQDGSWVGYSAAQQGFVRK